MSNTLRGRIGRTIALAAAPLALASLVLAPPASAAATGTVTGTVVDDTGAPVSGLVVTARSGGNTVLATTITNPDGTYSLVAPSGQRAVCFDGTGVATASGGYRFTCFGGASAAGATPVRVVAGQVRPGVDGTVTRNAVIRGRVTDGSGPLAGVGVARSFDGLVEATTGNDGRYRLVVDPVAHPSTRICFTGDRATGGSSTAGYDRACSTEVSLRAGSVRVVDQTLTPAAGAAGRVTDAAGRPVPGAEVVVFAGVSETTLTNADGRWRITGLSPAPNGRGTLLVTPPATAPGPDGTGLLTRCYGGSRPLIGTCFDGQTFALVAGRVTGGLDVTAPSGGALTGVVTDDDGTPIAGVAVTPVDSDDQTGQPTRSATSDANGTWRVIGLEPGTFAVCGAPSGQLSGAPDPDGYLPGCVGDDSGPREVTVVAGSTRTVTPLVLTGFGRVLGRVVDAVTGRGVGGVDVAVDTGSGADPVHVLTAPDGSYVVGDLHPGVVGICAFAPDTLPAQPPLGYADSCPVQLNPTFLTGARPFTARERGVTTGPTIALRQNGTVAGRVTDGSGFPLRNVGVEINNVDSQEFAYVYTDARGEYDSPSISPGPVTVCFHGDDAVRSADGTRPPGGYRYECWSNRDEPTPFTLQPGQRRTGIDAALAAAPPAG